MYRVFESLSSSYPSHEVRVSSSYLYMCAVQTFVLTTAESRLLHSHFREKELFASKYGVMNDAILPPCVSCSFFEFLT